MKKVLQNLVILIIAGFLLLSANTGCKGSKKFRFFGPVGTLQVEEVDPNDPENGGGTQDIPSKSDGELHPMFKGALGIPISSYSMGAVDPDPTGFNAQNDYDGDGILNENEVVSNAFVADYPRIVTRISAPITMEIRKDETNVTQNHTEIIENNDLKETITNSMEDKQYTQQNQKTTPYVTKESFSDSESNASSYGYSNTTETSVGVNLGFKGVFGAAEVSSGFNTSIKNSSSRNGSVSNSFAKSTMSEKMVFEDVDYTDNLDRNGVEFKNETVQNIARNYRKSEVSKSDTEIKPNAGLVRAALYLKNVTINMPVKISNVVCTLSFRTPAGQFLPVKTFKLRNEDYSEFNQEIYGDEELGPYTIEVANLNTHEVKKALANGYIPQIHVVSYDMHKVENSNYNPGVNNLKIVEETAKSRTATIKIVGNNMRELYRVAAFDVNQSGELSPGISLKKALFNVLRDRIGNGEHWDVDKNGNSLTVNDNNLKWKPGSPNSNEHTYSDNKQGNFWTMFETYTKSYTDEYNQLHRIETVKRIGSLKKYNPFDILDNPSYNENELLEEEEVMKMKYWIIFHNGRYFEGDINDPIWAGERYELVCLDVRDFNQHFDTFFYTPLQSMEYIKMDTRWNRLSNQGEFARAKYLGKLIKDDVVHLELNLEESRFLFDSTVDQSTGAGTPTKIYDNDNNHTGNLWYDFNYTLQPAKSLPNGVPNKFSHTVEGGTNSIIVTIEESKLAHSYDISFRQKGTTSWKIVAVSADELQKSNGTIYITRRSKDKDGNPIGDIDGGLEYDVYIKAVGRVYDVPVTTSSITNGQPESVAAVADVNSGVIPSSFTYNSRGMLNSLELMISPALNTEYYLVRYTGPLNYTSSSSTKEAYVHKGFNRIDIIPSFEVNNPGVYKVEVFAVNKNGVIGNDEDDNLIRASETGEMYITVEFDKYANQRVCEPRISSALFDKRALDFEVNFNDGSGWFRLRLASDDINNKNIECRYTSYIDYDTQKFHIFFKPPAGKTDVYGSTSDVFAGGREEVDLYIRTVAEKKYRDTFWMKEQNLENITPENMNFIVSGPTVNNFIDSWLNSNATDASYIEETLNNYGIENMGSIPGDNVWFKDAGMSDYFFSPLIHRKFSIKASIQETMTISGTDTLSLPEFTVTPGDRSILVSGIDSDNAESFDVYWKPINPSDNPYVGLYESLEQYPWMRGNTDKYDSNNKYYYTINGLTPFHKYVIAVVGRNNYGKSKPAFYGDNSGTADLIEVTTVMPYLGTPTEEAPTIYVSLSTENNKNIIVEGLYIPGECRYIVEWKESGEEWNQASTYDSYTDPNNTEPDKLVFRNIPVTISTHHNVPLKPWKKYDIRAKAVTLNNQSGLYKSGPDSEIKSIVSGIDAQFSGVLSCSNINDVNPSGTDLTRYVSLNINNIVIPEGTVEYSVNGKVIQTIRHMNSNTEIKNYTFSHPFVSKDITSLNSVTNMSISCLYYFALAITDWWKTTDITVELTVIVKNEYGETYTLDPISITATTIPNFSGI